MPVTDDLLAGRTAVCSYYPHGGKYGRCQEPQPSSTSLAFFEFLGEGSREALHKCTCGFMDIAHADVHPINPLTKRPNTITDHPFTPRGPAEHDRYYCGCWGWD